ncbi:MAG: SAM-dependent methyltransferase, partial [Dehalococcoidia bacterium]
MNATATAPAYKRRPEGAGPYALLTGAERYLHETRDEALLALLRRHSIGTLAGQRILELGCGRGALLRSLLHYGAEPDLLVGIDIDASATA